MVINNHEGNGKKVAHVFKEGGSKWLSLLMCTKEQRKKDFPWLNVSIPEVVWLIFPAAGLKLSEERRYLLIMPFGNWKLMMEAAF